MAAVAHIVGRCPAKALMRQYRVPSFASTDEFLQRVASSRGRLLPGGIADSQVGHIRTVLVRYCAKSVPAALCRFAEWRFLCIVTGPDWTGINDGHIVSQGMLHRC